MTQSPWLPLCHSAARRSVRRADFRTTSRINASAKPHTVMAPIGQPDDYSSVVPTSTSSVPPPAVSFVPSTTSQASSATLSQSPEPNNRVCSECGKHFARPSGLEAHMNSHTGAKPFRCGAVGCGAAFAARSNMLRHRRLHGQEVVEALEAAERQAAAAAPPPPVVFNAPIVNRRAEEGGPINVQWMVPNQAVRSYTRYPPVGEVTTSQAESSANSGCTEISAPRGPGAGGT
ncbi:hypothetical protein BD626DRAFT_486412 [Schizophyllum amplum]|uniref:C2H2-type domain-containing protein n=1 Tax=Schizophyllum amplum TaxID=97359 RepID=A0A550CMG0_9AGAR|nr:hypothetical protein BD626DRAFT_486412 [Auriculariopsis ampla]